MPHRPDARAARSATPLRKTARRRQGEPPGGADLPEGSSRRSHSPAELSLRHIRVVAICIIAVENPISVRVNIGNPATTHTGIGLARVEDAPVIAVQNAVLIEIRIRHPAPAVARLRLAGVVRAAVIAVGRAIVVRVIIRHTTPTGTFIPLLVRVIGTGVVAVFSAVSVSVIIGNTAPAGFGADLVRIVGAVIRTVLFSVTI